MSEADGPRLAKLVERAVRIFEETLPPEELDAAKCAILNDLTCAAVATGPVLHKAEAFTGTTTALPDDVATVLGTGSRHNAAEAAFLGGIRMHAHALDSTHYASQAHLGAAIIPAAMAIAEERRATGSELVAAIVAGWETAALIGETFVNGVLARGLRASTTFGTIGSATAAALTAGLTARETADAIALSANLSAGLTRTFLDGSDDWAVQLGLQILNGQVVSGSRVRPV
ncbi:MmgE/PrpD family protein [Micromonospora sp. NPDC047707]|uniref:MmgE/PrpD family protein n=1 Tax=Micromonospora sp. NPDC047707 TaxID=3154498 RepID=UPI003451D31D